MRSIQLPREISFWQILFLVLGLAANDSALASANEDLAPYYLNFTYPGRPDADPDAQIARGATLTSSPPLVNKVRAADGSFIAGPVDYIARIASITAFSPFQLGFFGERKFPCRSEPLVVPIGLTGGTTVNDQSKWRGPGPELCGPNQFVGPGPVNWTFSDNVTFGAAARRKAIDGGQYEASPMTIVRSGQSWMTYHWGYRLGLVASTANWDAANLSKVPELATWPNFPDAKDNFELVTLPPPWIENDVVEYVNRADFPNQPNGQYFYAVLASDKALLDSIPAWRHSGKSFKSGGYVSACRFYGGKNGGPNTHFYSADDKECALLKTIPQLSYEGQTFAVNVPLPGTNADGSKPCPRDSKPLYRVYNNASSSSGHFVSNHRYLTERADVAAVVAQGWVDEGQVMCVPM